MFERGVSFVPSAAPAGRARENWPVAYTRFPTITCAQTTPLICTVGNAAADTVSGSDGSTGAVSAIAGVFLTMVITIATFAPSSIAASTAAAALPRRRADDISRAARALSNERPTFHRPPRASAYSFGIGAE